MVEFLAEKVLEYTSAPGGTSLHYRPYFKVISDIVLNPTLVAGKDLSGPIGKLMNKVLYLCAIDCLLFDCYYSIISRRFLFLRSREAQTLS